MSGKVFPLGVIILSDVKNRFFYSGFWLVRKYTWQIHVNVLTRYCFYSLGNGLDDTSIEGKSHQGQRKYLPPYPPPSYLLSFLKRQQNKNAVFLSANYCGTREIKHIAIATRLNETLRMIDLRRDELMRGLGGTQEDLRHLWTGKKQNKEHINRLDTKVGRMIDVKRYEP